MFFEKQPLSQISGIFSGKNGESFFIFTNCTVAFRGV